MTGQANLRRLAPLVVVEVLYGPQQRVRGECTSYCRFLRRLVWELRRPQAAPWKPELNAGLPPVRYCT